MLDFVSMVLAALIVVGLMMGVAIAFAFKYRGWIRTTWSTLRDVDRHGGHVQSICLILYQQNRTHPVFPPHHDESPFGAGEWKKIGGDGIGWEVDAFYKVRGLAWCNGSLFASVTGPKTDGPRSEVWRWNDRRWTLTGGRGKAASRGRTSFVDHLSCYGGRIYSANAGGIWRLDDDEWHDVTGCLRVNENENGSAYVFCEWRGKLVVGFWGVPTVAVFDQGDWTEIRPPVCGWGSNVRTIYCLAAYRDALYVGTGTGKLAGSSSTVWRYDGNLWEQVAGDGIRGSWIQEGLPFVLSLTVFGTHLIATLSRPPETPAPTSSVWAFDGDEWMPIASGRTPELMVKSMIVNDSIVYGGRLVVATGDGAHRRAEVWELDGHGGWKNVGGEVFRAPDNGHDGGYWIYRLCTDGRGSLFASTAGHQGAARVFQFQSAVKDIVRA